MQAAVPLAVSMDLLQMSAALRPSAVVVNRDWKHTYSGSVVPSFAAEKQDLK